jgi:hypothetical protein
MAYTQAAPHHRVVSDFSGHQIVHFCCYCPSLTSNVLRLPDLRQRDSTVSGLDHLLYLEIHISHPLVLGRDSMVRDWVAWGRLEVEV